jgi:hypothetical protein
VAALKKTAAEERSGPAIVNWVLRLSRTVGARDWALSPLMAAVGAARVPTADAFFSGRFGQSIVV